MDGTKRTPGGGPEARTSPVMAPAGLLGPRGRFEFLETLGTGGNGSVHRVRCRRSGEVLALKLPAGPVNEETRSRFEREARQLSRISHPNVVGFRGAGLSTGTPYLLMECVAGAEPRGPLPAPRVRALLDGAARGLRALHSRGLVHRDVKPANLLVTHRGRVVLVDLGITRTGEDEALTRTGLVNGTPGFTAPEAFLDPTPTPALDWFAWGATGFLLAEGRMPFPSAELIRSAGSGTLPPLEFRILCPDSPLARQLAAALSLEPSTRAPRTPGEEPASLSTRVLARQRPPRAAAPRTLRSFRRSPVPPRRLAAAAALVLAVGGALTWPRGNEGAPPTQPRSTWLRPEESPRRPEGSSRRLEVPASFLRYARTRRETTKGEDRRARFLESARALLRKRRDATADSS